MADRPKMVDAVSASSGKMPEPRRLAGVERLSTSLSEATLFERFMREFSGGRRALFTDAVGHDLIIEQSLFLNQKGRWKIQKGERAAWLLFTALNIRQPDEIWLEPGRGGGPDRLYYLSRFDVGRRGLLACLAVFEREQDAKGAWSGRTSFATTQDHYAERKRDKDIIDGSLKYRRWE